MPFERAEMLFPGSKDRKRSQKNVIRNCGCLGPEFVRTSQLVEENMTITLSWATKSWTSVGLLLKVIGGVGSVVNGRQRARM